MINVRNTFNLRVLMAILYERSLEILLTVPLNIHEVALKKVCFAYGRMY